MYPREAIDFEEPYVSPYLRRPLRSIEEVLEERAARQQPQRYLTLDEQAAVTRALRRSVKVIA
jgi:hypothetical protein